MVDKTNDAKLLCAIVKEAGHTIGGRGMRFGVLQRDARWEGVCSKQKGDGGGDKDYNTHAPWTKEVRRRLVCLGGGGGGGWGMIRYLC